MEADEAMAALPETYARALRLREHGLSDGDIAREVGIPADAAGALLRLAAAKLDRLRTQASDETQE